MQFKDVVITNAGKKLAARAAASKGKILWTIAKFSEEGYKSGTLDTLRAITTFAPDSKTVANGKVIASLNDSNAKTCTLHCELAHVKAGSAKSFAIWAKLDTDSAETLTILGRTGKGVHPILLSDPANGLVKLSLDIELALEDFQLTSIVVNSESGALVSALAKTNEAVESMYRQQFRLYDDLWEAFDKSKDGDFFGVKSEGRRQVVDRFGSIPLDGQAEFKVLQFLGRYAMCSAKRPNTELNRMDYLIAVAKLNALHAPLITITEEEVSDMPTFLDYEENQDGSLKAVLVSNMTAPARWISAEGEERLDQWGTWIRTNAGVFLFQRNNSEDDKPRAYHYKNRQLVRIFENQLSTLSEEGIQKILAGYLVLFQGKNVIVSISEGHNTKPYYSYSFENGDIIGALLPTELAMLENAIWAIKHTDMIYLNGKEYGNVLAFDCSSKTASIELDQDLTPAETYFKRDKNLRPGHSSRIPAFQKSYSSKNFDSSVNSASAAQPLGLRIFKTTHKHYVWFWPGAYHSLVNRNGIILPRLDSPPHFPNSNNHWGALS